MIRGVPQIDTIENDRGRERPATDDEQARGLECPECGCRHFYVLSTRQGATFILRRRECRNCGKRVTTRETTIKK